MFYDHRLKLYRKKRSYAGDNLANHVPPELYGIDNMNKFKRKLKSVIDTHWRNFLVTCRRQT